MAQSRHDLRHGGGFGGGFVGQEVRADFIAGLEGSYFWASGVDNSCAVGGGDYRVGESEGV